MIEFSRDITRRAIERLSKPDGTVYYRGDGFGVEETLALLCRLNRYVLAELPRRCEPVAARMRRETGAAIMLNPPRERVLSADLAILEDTADMPEFSENCVVYDAKLKIILTNGLH